ncbi:MAG: hypothetical protein U9N05_04085, partial [Euryarchaeota archaeon]|nr:hypothetical protein [Euryarchaeota archaeon]
MRKVVLLLLIFLMLVGTAQASLTVTDGYCEIKKLEETVTVTLTLKNSGHDPINVYAPSLPSPTKGITLRALDSYGPLVVPGNSSKDVKIEVSVAK